MINILSICGNLNTLKIFRFIKITLSILKIIFLFLVLYFFVLMCLKSYLYKDDNLTRNKSKKSFFKVLGSVCVFFLFLIYLYNTSDEYRKCINNATKEKIKIAYDENIKEIINLAKNTFDKNDYDKAMSLIKNINDYEKRKQYEEELRDVKNIIDIKLLINKLNHNNYVEIEKNINKILSEVDDLSIRNNITDDVNNIIISIKLYLDKYSSDGAVYNMLAIPYYDQCDSRWGKIVYDIGNSNGQISTFCSSSCGYTALAMVISGLSKNPKITPVSVVEELRKINISKEEKTTLGYGSAVNSELIDEEFLSKYSINSEVVNVSNYNESYTNIMKELNNKNPIIILVQEHYLVLIKGNNDGIILLDPSNDLENSKKNSGEYSFDYIWNTYGQIKWAAVYSRYK